MLNRDAWVTRAQAAFMTGVSADAIGKWRARGWIGRDGTRRYLQTRRLASNRLLYRFGDLLDAESDTHRSGKGHRAEQAAA